MASWLQHPIHFLDFEGNRASGVLEYGMVQVLGGAIGWSRTRLCRATGRVSAEETAVHGLKAGDTAAAEPLSADWELFAGWREAGPFAAHFAGVENGLIKATWPHPRAVPHFGRPGERHAEWGPWVDTAILWSQAGRSAEGASSSAAASRSGATVASTSAELSSRIAALGLQVELDALAAVHCPPERRRYHAALYDALAGALLLVRLARDPSWAALTMPQLLALSTRDADRREEMTQGRLW